MKRWYVVQVYAGYEEAVKKDITRRIQELGLEEDFGQVLIPSARMKQFFDPEQQEQEPEGEQLFPGYLLVELEAKPETIRVVATSPKVIKFLGGSREPISLPRKEVDRIFSQMKGEVKVAAKKSEFAVGGEVEIQEGPFAGFVGIIEDIDEENERLTIMVSIFGRMTPVELGFNQVKR